jgi:hypothetical protein
MMLTKPDLCGFCDKLLCFLLKRKSLSNTEAFPM